jgi:hypothetical protein
MMQIKKDRDQNEFRGAPFINYQEAGGLLPCMLFRLFTGKLWNKSTA